MNSKNRLDSGGKKMKNYPNPNPLASAVMCRPKVTTLSLLVLKVACAEIENKKTATLLARFTSPSSLGRSKILWGAQCNLSQKKSNIAAWILESRPRGGSIHIRQCYRADVTGLL